MHVKPFRRCNSLSQNHAFTFFTNSVIPSNPTKVHTLQSDQQISITVVMTSNSAFGWVWKQSMKVQVSVTVIVFIATIIALYYFLDTDLFYVFSEVLYTIANLILVYKLIKHRSCTGISLRAQEVTAVFVASRLTCTLADDMGLELHTVLDSISLVATGWVIYMMRFKLRSSYAKELDNMPIHYLLVPCFVLSLIVTPSGLDMPWSKVFVFVAWAFSTYTEAVSVLPQLRMIQNSKMVETVTGHYVFALGLSRFFGFGHWVLVIYETGGKSLLMFGTRWFLWPAMNTLAEIVQTFILADFCYYYVRSVVHGRRMTLPTPN